MQLQETAAGGAVSTAAVPVAPGGGGTRRAAADAADAPRIDLLSNASVDLLAIREDDFCALPEPRLGPLMTAQLYASSPYNVGPLANICAVLGGNALFWLLPARWGLPDRPPYAVSPRFAAFRHRVVLRDAWRAANSATAAALDKAWKAAHGGAACGKVAAA
jgi:hypothetical protein